MRTLHTNITDFSGQVYCFRSDAIVKLTQDFLDEQCLKCPYFYSDSYGDGVECYFDDGSNEDRVTFHDPSDSEKWSKYVEVRLGIKTRAEIDGMLKGVSSLTSAKELRIPEHHAEPPSLEDGLEEEEVDDDHVSRKNAGEITEA